jgi:geranylgeranyl reductase family protein
LYDAIVVGAGPAGNIVALRLASQGHSVVVLDWRRDIGDKLCTGIIGVECADHFPPDKSLVYHAANSATVVSPGGSRYRIARSRPEAFIVDRVSYVGSMAARAMDAGAEFRLGARVTCVDVGPNDVAVTMTNESGRTDRARARLVVVAAGFGSPVLDMVGLGKGRGRSFMSSAQAQVQVNGLEDTEVYLGDRFSPGSFGWLVPLSGSMALAGIMSQQKLNGHMDGLLQHLRKTGKVRSVVQQPRRWAIPLRPISRTFGDRVLAVGDAAGFAKPTTGGGIYYALRSGKLAAEIAHLGLSNGDLSSRAMRVYQTRWRSLFGRELTVGYYARKLYEALGDGQIDRLLRASADSGLQDELVNSSEFAFDWHSRLILKVLRPVYLGSVIRSFGPVVRPILSRLLGQDHAAR